MHAPHHPASRAHQSDPRRTMCVRPVPSPGRRRDATVHPRTVGMPRRAARRTNSTQAFTMLGSIFAFLARFLRKEALEWMV